MRHDLEVQEILKDLRDNRGYTYAGIGRLLGGVNKGLVKHAYDGHHSPKVRKALGLPYLRVETDPCDQCGEVHKKKSCVYKLRQQHLDRMGASLSIEEGRAARQRLAELGYGSITEFWRAFMQGEVSGGAARTDSL